MVTPMYGINLTKRADFPDWHAVGAFHVLDAVVRVREIPVGRGADEGGRGLAGLVVAVAVAAVNLE
jgi:hypothetical protein